MYILKINIIAIFIHLSVGDEVKLNRKVQEGFEISVNVYTIYINLFEQCLTTSMPNQSYPAVFTLIIGNLFSSARFIADNLHSYINAFSKTTVGYSPDFTSNRKFFANMINTAEFKTVLQKDINVLQNNIIEKIKFCDDSIMDQESLKLTYDREVDQTKQ